MVVLSLEVNAMPLFLAWQLHEQGVCPIIYRMTRDMKH